MNYCESEIKGGGRNTFGFDFLPKEYAINKNRYIQNKEIEIKTSTFEGHRLVLRRCHLVVILVI